MAQTTDNHIIKRLRANMAFANPSDVTIDTRRAGILRANSQVVDANPRQAFEMHSCRLEDWSAPDASPLDLETMGFDTVDLSPLTTLQSILETERARSHITGENASLIRRKLTGRAFTLSSGKRLKLVLIAPEGLIMRRAGPNGCKIAPDEAMTEMNGHDSVLTVHADQDVRGTPLKQMLKGTAPWIFRHHSPDSRNRLSPSSWSISGYPYSR